jgi:hypothetical protein
LGIEGKYSVIRSTLANHLAAIPFFAGAVINGKGKKTDDAVSNAELLEALDEDRAAGREALASTSDDLAATMPALNMTRVDMLRERISSHTQPDFHFGRCPPRKCHLKQRRREDLTYGSTGIQDKLNSLGPL